MIKVTFIALAMMLSGVSVASADDAYPTHPIRFIVPFEPGSETDAECRVLADAVGKQLGQSLVVENTTGAEGTTGFNLAAKANPDGYTILSATPGFVVNPFIQKGIAYDPAKDFAPVIQVSTSPVLLVVSPDSPVHSIRDLLDMARAHPGQVRYGSAGIGSIGHLGGALLGALGGVRLTHVPNSGSALVTIDLLAGRLTFQMENATAVLPQVRTGQLRAIAVGSAAPSALLPGVPTIAASIQGYEASDWLGILVQAKTPKPVIKRLNAAFSDALADPQVQEAMSAFGVELVGGSPEVFGKYLQAQSAELKTVAQAANLVRQ